MPIGDRRKGNGVGGHSLQAEAGAAVGEAEPGVSGAIWGQTRIELEPYWRRMTGR